ncbi:MAG: phosphate ABC transporter substrate-binding protein PstS [Gammaproteobacteria bacterium]|nr:phosphate ABC transporter substrate-binding protein PstS [Gammaproteobacteria bacterium]MDH5511801.1 phosphate ABC transporter substrate-binding protein PstS [Gammaproteobacteria bacterium]
MRFSPTHVRLLLLAGAAIFGLNACQGERGTNLNGAGATFPYPIYAKWGDAYKTETGVGVNYQSIGSGGGIKQIQSKTVDFGASDKPLSVEELNASGLIQFPMVMGGVVPVVNLEGVKPGELKLTGAVLGDIYLGKITAWNDAVLRQLNPDLKLPDDKITVVARADGSGTTFIFTHYLSMVSPAFREKIGNNTSVAWITGVSGKGNEGVASYVQRLKGSLGYVEYAYALQNRMTVTQLQNRAGKFVKPDSESFQAAAAGADWAGTPGFNLMLTDQPGEKSWPITGATFILVYRQQDKPETAREVLKFFDWAYRHGDKLADALDYVPMPASVVKLVEATWEKEIKDSAGKPVWTATTAKK